MPKIAATWRSASSSPTWPGSATSCCTWLASATRSTAVATNVARQSSGTRPVRQRLVQRVAPRAVPAARAAAWTAASAAAARPPPPRRRPRRDRGLAARRRRAGRCRGPARPRPAAAPPAARARALPAADERALRRGAHRVARTSALLWQAFSWPRCTLLYGAAAPAASCTTTAAVQPPNKGQRELQKTLSYGTTLVYRYLPWYGTRGRPAGVTYPVEEVFSKDFERKTQI